MIPPDLTRPDYGHFSNIAVFVDSDESGYRATPATPSSRIYFAPAPDAPISVETEEKECLLISCEAADGTPYIYLASQITEMLNNGTLKLRPQPESKP